MAPFKVPNSRRWSRLSGLFLGVVLLFGCNQTSTLEQKAPTVVPLSVIRYENEFAFDLLYPSDWTYTIVMEGLILFGESKTVDLQETGASVSIFRRPLDDVRGGLEGTFQHFLNSGPLQNGFAARGESTVGRLGGQDALQVTVERGANEDQPAMTAFIVAAESNSGPIYILSATAPSEEWDENWPSFQILVGSFEFNE